MKRLISILLCIMMLGLYVLPAYATETISGELSCTHNWSVTNETEATCTTDGSKTFSCSNCNETKTETVSASGHNFGTSSVLDDASHKKTCSVCGTSVTESHEWGSGTVITQASCTMEGSKSYTCSCGKTKTEPISKLEHNYGEWVKTSDSHERSCQNCTNKEFGNHSVKEEVIKEATCLETGSKKKYCTVCGISEMSILPKLTEHVYDNVCDSKCNVCEAERTTTHSYGSSWSRDHAGHWHECTKCGEKVDYRDHYPGPAATEDAPQLCLTCDYVIAQQKAHQHNYGKQWTKDETGHWYTCATCDVKKDFAKHVYDSDCDDYCNTCDFENPDAHDYGNDWQKDEKKHWSVCKVCNQKTEQELHIPGPEATEDSPQLCTVCGFEMAPVQEHIHSFGPVWMYDGKTHWQACECGEQTVPSAHDWDNGSKNKDKTVTYQCTQCQAERSEKASGFPWWVLVIFLLLAAGGGAAAYIYYVLPQKQGGKFAAK